MRLPASLAISICAALFAATDAAHAFGIGARVGTLGVGGDIGWRVAPTLSARLGWSGLRWDRDVSTDDVHYDGNLKLSNLSGMLDFSPLGPFRLTAGLVYNDNKYDMRAEPSGNAFRIAGRTYSASDVGSFGGTVKAGRSLAPYFGVGYGSVAGLGVNVYADFGIMFQGSPKASLAANCGPALGASACAQLQSDIAAEQVRLEDKLKRFKYYPVVNIGVTIGF